MLGAGKRAAARRAAWDPFAAETIQRAEMLLERVGLADRREHRPAELSGGERQRAALARALINAPDLLLADEPTGNLDRTTAQQVGQLLVELQKTEPMILIVVTHSQRLAELLANAAGVGRRPASAEIRYRRNPKSDQ